MGKIHKNHKPQSTPAPTPALAVSPTALPIFAPAAARVPLGRRIALQFTVVLGLSTALGFVFNSANPIGVRFEDPGSRAELRSGLATNLSLLSTSSVAAKTTAPVPQSAVATAPVAQPSPAPLPPVKIPITPVAPTVAYTAPPIVVSNLPHTHTPPAVGVSPTNPAPIHWREAKPLAAAGQAVLVDVRPRPVYDAGHIPDAVSLPETSSPAEFAAFLKLLPANTTLIVYCASTSCSQSKRVADRLVAEFHYTSVKYMTGGYLEYQQQELAKPQPPPTPAER